MPFILPTKKYRDFHKQGQDGYDGCDAGDVVVLMLTRGVVSSSRIVHMYDAYGVVSSSRIVLKLLAAKTRKTACVPDIIADETRPPARFLLSYLLAFVRENRG
jgi:hypothetical protein